MSIMNFLATVKDYRKLRGKRYTLSSVLRLVLAGLLCGTNNLATIHRWAKTLSKKALIDLGLYKGRLLSYSNLTVILRQVDCGDIAKVMNDFDLARLFRTIFYTAFCSVLYCSVSYSTGDK